MKEEITQLRESIAAVLRDNITFSGQAGDYVIHGAIDKIIEYFKTHPSHHDSETKMFSEIKRLNVEVINGRSEFFLGWRSCFKWLSENTDTNKEIDELKREIERLKGLIFQCWWHDNNPSFNEDKDDEKSARKKYERFKKENNL